MQELVFHLVGRRRPGQDPLSVVSYVQEANRVIYGEQFDNMLNEDDMRDLVALVTCHQQDSPHAMTAIEVKMLTQSMMRTANIVEQRHHPF